MRRNQDLSTLQKKWLLEEPAERGKRYYWRGLGVVCLVLLFGVSEILPNLPAKASVLASEAIETCGEAVDVSLESRCSELVWATCEETRVLWQRTSTQNGNWDEWSEENKTRFFMHDFFCRVAHMAELIELAAVLADKYGEKFWKEIYTKEEYVYNNFWRFRVFISYTPWAVLDYPRASQLTDTAGELASFSNSAGNTASGIYDNNNCGAKWLDRVLCRPLNEVSMSSGAEDIINDLLEIISHNVEFYDFGTGRTGPASGWDFEFENEDRLRRIEAIYGKGTIFYWPRGLFDGSSQVQETLKRTPWVVSGADSEEVLLCQWALVAARVGQVGWQSDIDRCKSDAASCDGDLAGIRQYCESLAVLAGMERMWQLLPGVCAAAEYLGTVDDECRRAALEICGVDVGEREGLDRFLKRRFYDIHNSACALARPLEDFLEEMAAEQNSSV